MVVRAWMSLALILLTGNYAAHAQGAEPARSGVVVDGPQFKLSFYVVERAVSDQEPAKKYLKARTLAAAEVAAWFDTLQDRRHNKTLSHPTLVTVDRHAAQLTVGGERLFTIGYDGERPVTKMVPVGIRLSATPTQLDDGRVRIELAMSISHVTDVEQTTSPASSPDVLRQIELPTVFEQALSSSILLPVGGAAVVSGEVRETDGKRHRTEVLVTIERFDIPR